MTNDKCENIHTFYLEGSISCYWSLNKNSKELFDYDIHQRKDDILKKRCNLQCTLKSYKKKCFP